MAKAIFNGRKIAELGFDLLAYGRAYGRDVIFLASYRDKLQEMAYLKEELEQLNRELGMIGGDPLLPNTTGKDDAFLPPEKDPSRV